MTSLKERAINSAIAADPVLEEYVRTSLSEVIVVLKQKGFADDSLLFEDFDHRVVKAMKGKEYDIQFFITLDDIPFRVDVTHQTSKGKFEGQYRFLKWEEEVEDDPFLSIQMYPPSSKVTGIYVERPDPIWYAKGRTKWVAVKSLEDLGKILIAEEEDE